MREGEDDAEGGLDTLSSGSYIITSACFIIIFFRCPHSRVWSLFIIFSAKDIRLLFYHVHHTSSLATAVVRHDDSRSNGVEAVPSCPAHPAHYFSSVHSQPFFRLSVSTSPCLRTEVLYKMTPKFY